MMLIDVKGICEYIECFRGYRGGKIVYLFIVIIVVIFKFYLIGNEYFIWVNSIFI